MAKRNEQHVADLETFRNSLSGKIAMAPGYQFKFFKTRTNSGGLEITDLDDKIKYNTSYSFVVKDGKCELSLNLAFKPFNLSGFPKVNYDNLEHDLTKLLDRIRD